jgi:hypothetical protein
MSKQLENAGLQKINDFWVGSDKETCCPSKIYWSIYYFIRENPKTFQEIFEQIKKTYPEYDENFIAAYVRRALALINELPGELDYIEIKKDERGYFNPETDIKKYYVPKVNPNWDL